MNKKILLCFGTRPEAIKMGALVHQLQSSKSLDVKICVTAQHREMLDQVLHFFEIIPDFDLDVMQPNQSLNELSANIFYKMEKVFLEFLPDLVLVHGDTTTSSICAWAAFNHRIKVGHVEAGLRTYDKNAPFPEELNRQITGRISDFHFAPTVASKENLLEEKIDSKSILVTGNTVIDSLFWTTYKLDNGYMTKAIDSLKSQLDFSKKIVLVTAHRRENLGGGLVNICKALLEIADNNCTIVFPVHLNPNVRKVVFKMLSDTKNIKLVDSLDYPSFVWLMQQSYLIISDSGGIQEEAPALGKPVLVLRDVTERPEAVDVGTVKLVGTNVKKIVDATNSLLNNDEIYNKMSHLSNPYGDGKATKRILNFIKKN